MQRDIQVLGALGWILMGEKWGHKAGHTLGQSLPAMSWI